MDGRSELGWRGWMVGRGKSCWLPLVPAAGWVSILSGLDEGRRLPSGSSRLRDHFPHPNPSMIRDERKVVGSVGRPDPV